MFVFTYIHVIVEHVLNHINSYFVIKLKLVPTKHYFLHDILTKLCRVFVNVSKLCDTVLVFALSLFNEEHYLA